MKGYLWLQVHINIELDLILISPWLEKQSLEGIHEYFNNVVKVHSQESLINIRLIVSQNFLIPN